MTRLRTIIIYTVIGICVCTKVECYVCKWARIHCPGLTLWLHPVTSYQLLHSDGRFIKVRSIHLICSCLWVHLNSWATLAWIKLRQQFKVFFDALEVSLFDDESRTGVAVNRESDYFLTRSSRESISAAACFVVKNVPWSCRHCSTVTFQCSKMSLY